MRRWVAPGRERHCVPIVQMKTYVIAGWKGSSDESVIYYVLSVIEFSAKLTRFFGRRYRADTRDIAAVVFDQPKS